MLLGVAEGAIHPVVSALVLTLFNNVVGQMNISVINFYCVLFQPIMSIESLNENKKTTTKNKNTKK
jgi:hypothetical protein